jgi:Na+/melibiose symporter-like transporter
LPPHAAPVAPVASTAQAAGAPLSIGAHLNLSVLWFALNFQFAALLPVVIPAQIALFVAPGAAGNARQALLLAALAAIGAAVTLVMQPLVGALSDRTTLRMGRRRPYIVGGTLLLLAGLALLALTHNLVLYVAGLTIVVIAHTISGTAYQGLLPDCVPEHQRGTASGYMGLMTMLGTAGSLAVASLLLSQSGAGHALVDAIAHGASEYYGIAGLIVLAAAVITVVGVRETPLPDQASSRSHASHTSTHHLHAVRRRERLRRHLDALWLDPWRHHNFRWVFLTRGFVMLGLALFMTFIAYYFARVVHTTNFVQATAINAVMALLGAVCSALLLGMLADRMPKVPVVCVSTGFMAAAALVFVVAPPGGIPLWPLGILFGLGYGAFTSVDWALALDALPSLSACGKDLGLWSIASTLPGILAPVVGGAVIVAAGALGVTDLGYRCVFALATLSLVLGALFVLKVRETRRTGRTADQQDSAAA